MVTPEWGKFQKPSDFQEQSTQETPLQQQEQRQEEEDKPQPQWGQFLSPQTYQGEPDPTEEESTFGYAARQLVSNASRLVETSLGKYGDIESTAKSVLTNYPLSGGLIGYALSEWVGPDRWKKLVQGNEPSQMFPTSPQLKEASEKVTGGYTKPKTPGEEKFQNFVLDVGPLTSLRTGRIPTARQVGSAGLANVGKEAVKGLGFDEEKSTYAKMGIWTVLSLLDKVNAPRYAAEMTNRARNAFGPNLNADVPRYQQRLQQVANDPTILVSDPRTALARDQINRLNQNIANGQNSIQSLLTAYDGVNAAKRSSGMFELGRPGDRRFAAGALDRVLGVVRDEIRDAGSANPQALRDWQNAIGAWRTIHQSNVLSNWVQSLSNGPYAKYMNGIATTLFGTGVYSAYHDPLLAASVAATGFAANKIFQVGYRVMNDPVLAEYYTNALTAAARQDAPVFIKNFRKLNEKLEKDKSITGISKARNPEKTNKTKK